MADEIRLPIKIVIPVRTDFRKISRKRGPRKVFGDTNSPAFRARLVDQVLNIYDHFDYHAHIDARLPRVARVILKDEALAKTHRLVRLFSADTCPIIGGQDLGQILISVQQIGLDLLLKKLREDTTAVGIADISTLERIEPYTSDDALKISPEAIEKLKKDGQIDLKFRLFRHFKPDLDKLVLASFHHLVNRFNLTSQHLDYGENEIVFRLRNVPAQIINSLAGFVGVQSVSDFPFYQAVRAQAIPLREAQIDDFPAPNKAIHYPVVGVVDTGTNPNDPLLAAWRVGREEMVPDQFRDYNHGSFVAGLIVNGKILNHSDLRFPDSQAQFVDIVAIPGRGDSIREDDLLAILEEVIPKYPKVKVWNLSLSKEGSYCQDDTFSDFGIALDNLQARYGIRFVIAAGNYNKPPFRSWPPTDDVKNDRINPPADSVRAVTVGAIAHVDNSSSRVKREEPSPFSRRGPGACFLPKPEVSHYGGNCDGNGRYQQTGILSIDGSRRLAENIGTSFSTPLVSSLLANIYDSIGSEISHVLAKALLIHSAILRSDRLTAENLNYTGFGIPNDLAGILTCDPYTATLIFEPGEVRPGWDFVKGGFPIPECLRTEEGKVRGEFIITLVYDPPLDSKFGAEYCRRNCEVSLGTYNPHGPKEDHNRRIPCEPQDISELYEKARIEHGFKWSPVKVYRQEFPNGIKGDHWRIVVEAQDRSGFGTDEKTPIAVVVSIRDPKRTQLVYDNVVALMNRNGWITQNLRVNDRIRLRNRS